jgi:lauroyl/myristoyl acyltransferase
VASRLTQQALNLTTFYRKPKNPALESQRNRKRKEKILDNIRFCIYKK